MSHLVYGHLGPKVTCFVQIKEIVTLVIQMRIQIIPFRSDSEHLLMTVRVLITCSLHKICTG